jgi:hypothetical protein
MVRIAWDGRRLVIGSIVGSELTLRLLDTDSFSTVGAWTSVVKSFPVLITASGDTAAYTSDRAVTIVSNDNPPRVMNAPFRHCGVLFDSVMFVNANAIALTCFNQIQLSDLLERDLLHTQFSKDLRFLSAFPSRSGNRIGLRVGEPLTYLFAPIVDPPYSAVIYETNTWTRIYERRFPGDSSQPIAEFALSPEGSFMAMLSKGHRGRSDGDIQLFHLPQIPFGAPVSSQR